MSQREKAGFSWPPLPVPAGEPGAVLPESCAASLIENCFLLPLGLIFANGSLLTRPPLPECMSGVGHAVSIFTSVARFVCSTLPVLLFTHFSPFRSKSSLIFPADPRAEGVGHGARCTACSFNGRAFFAIVSSLVRPSRQSRLAGVAQEVSWKLANSSIEICRPSCSRFSTRLSDVPLLPW